MLLSIIVPIYNVEKYLRRCINSLLEQNFDDAEIILIDDCSIDNSLMIAKEYDGYDNVKVISKSCNTGLSDTRNLGLKSAKGEYVVFLDSDDYVEENSFKSISNIIEESKKSDVIYFGYIEEFEERNSFVKRYGYVSEKNHLYTSEEFAISELGQRTLFAAACFGIYRRKYIIENNLFFKTGIFHEDELWTPQIVMNARTIYTSDYIYYHYLRRKNSITQRDDKTKNGIDLINICKELDYLFVEISNPMLKKYMDNHIAMLYMKGMSEGKLYKKENRNIIDRFYPIKKTCFVKDRVKAMLFAFSLRLYYILNNL